MKNTSKIICPVQYALGILNGKWKLPILHALHKGSPKRFKVLEREIAGITPTVLTTQLKDMLEHGLITREVFATAPPSVEYSVTTLGKSLQPLIYELKKWGVQHMRQYDKAKNK
jgi:DNA-binding HxlR family transcriptional regulator